MTGKVTYAYPKVLTFDGVFATVRAKLQNRGLYNQIKVDTILNLLSSVTAPVGVFPPAPLTKAKTKPNLGDFLVYGTVGDMDVYFNPYFFADTGEVKHKKGSDDPNFPLERYTQGIAQNGCEEAHSNRWYIAVPPELGRIVEEGYERGYKPFFTNNVLYLFAFPPGAKPVVQTGTLPVLVVFHLGDSAYPLTGDFQYWDAKVRKGDADISEKTKNTYRRIRSNYAIVKLDGVTYPTGVQSLNESRAAEKAERAEQAARAKGRKAILSGGQVGEDAETIGLTEQGYQNLLTLGYPYMISKYDYGNKARPYDPAQPPPEYAQAVAGALAFLARQDPTIILGRGPVSDYARSIVDSFLRTSHLVHQSEADRKAKVEKMIKEDAGAKRKLALWKQNRWDHRGLKEEDRFYPYEGGNIYFDQTYSMLPTVAAVVNHLHLGHDEAQKYGQQVYDARTAALTALGDKYENMPEKVEQREREKREEREREERNERRPQVKKEIQEQMGAWIGGYPTVDIGKALKSTKNLIFYVDGDWYLPAPKGTKVKQGYWLLLNADGHRCTRLVTEGRVAPLEKFVEAYDYVAEKLPEAMPVPSRSKNARYEALRWEDRQRLYPINRRGGVEQMIVLAQEKLASKPESDGDE